jgi:hypothetical protein
MGIGFLLETGTDGPNHGPCATELKRPTNLQRNEKAARRVSRHPAMKSPRIRGLWKAE